MSAMEATVLGQKKAKTKSRDAPKNHGLFQMKSLSPEAQRISKILENCISQVKIVTAISTGSWLNCGSGAVNEELRRAVQQHQLLEERLHEDLKQELDGGQEEEDRKGRKGERAQLERDIQNSVRNLLRLVRAQQDTVFGLKAQQDMGPEESEHILIRGLETFYSHMVEKLLTSVDEELQLALHSQVSSSLDSDLKKVVLREEKLAAAMKEVDEAISKKNDNIKNCQLSLQEMNTQDTSVSLITETQCQAHINTSKMKQTTVQQEIDQLNVELNKLILENRKAERVIQEKTEKLERETEYLIQMFDDEMEKKQANLEMHEMEHEREEGELQQLEKPFSVLEAECNEIQERRRLAEEKRKEEMKALELKTKAAILGQAWWRGYSTRKALKNKGKNKKARKGKGKKTK